MLFAAVGEVVAEAFAAVAVPAGAVVVPLRGCEGKGEEGIFEGARPEATAVDSEASAQQRKSKGVVSGVHSAGVWACAAAEPAADAKVPSGHLSDKLHTRAWSIPQPDPFAASALSSISVQSRAPRCMHRAKATGKLTFLARHRAPPCPAMLLAQTRLKSTRAADTSTRQQHTVTAHGNTSTR